jgi:hypothetical protein
VAGSITLIFDPPEKDPPLAIVLGSFMTLASCWGVAKGARLIFGWRTNGGLMGPVALRVIAVIYLILPVVGIFTQHYSRFGLVAVLQAIAYLLVFFGLLRMAKARSQQSAQQGAQDRRAEDSARLS